jgi:hypothetical protein
MVYQNQNNLQKIRNLSKIGSKKNRRKGVGLQITLPGNMITLDIPVINL